MKEIISINKWYNVQKISRFLVSEVSSWITYVFIVRLNGNWQYMFIYVNIELSMCQTQKFYVQDFADKLIKKINFQFVEGVGAAAEKIS